MAEVQHQVHALGVQAAGNLGADAVGRAGDEGDFTRQGILALRHWIAPCLMDGSF